MGAMISLNTIWVFNDARDVAIWQLIGKPAKQVFLDFWVVGSAGLVEQGHQST